MLLDQERPGVFPPEQRASVTALACSLPQTHGVSLARWSRSELVRLIACNPQVPSVSTSTIGRWLKQERIQPWRYRYWQHIQDPDRFLERACPVLHLYEQAQALYEQGTWLVCCDEKTSLQAREAEQAPLPAMVGSPQHQSPRYHRRGARHLIAGLSVADGQVSGCCTQRKCFADFRSFLETVILPEAQRRHMHDLILILDNGTTHASKQLTRWIEEHNASQDCQLRMQVVWLPTNASWLDQIEIWFSILQRKLLQPNHFVSTDQLEQAIARFIDAYNLMAQPIKWSYTVDKLVRKLGVHS